LWYFAQSFEGTGALVLMIEKVIQDCLYFVLLASFAMIGFGLALFITFQSSSRNKNCNNDELQAGECKENEIKDKINMSFGSPWMAILTMFYAMLGTVEVEVSLKHRSHLLLVRCTSALDQQRHLLF